MQVPGWFRALLVTVLLLLCMETCWYAVSMQHLTPIRDDLILQLSTSRQREKKQQYEYEQVCEALPKVLAELAELQPQADAAKAREQQLRDQRKALRADIAALKQQLEALNAAEP